jgi:hypothetical protein
VRQFNVERVSEIWERWGLEICYYKIHPFTSHNVLLISAANQRNLSLVEPTNPKDVKMMHWTADQNILMSML